VNARPRPLALYYFGDNDADRRRVLDRTTSGNVTMSGRTISRSAASARAGWASTTGSRASGHSATPRASSCRVAGTAHASCGPLRQACRCSPRLLPSMTWRAATVDGDACRPSAFAWQRPIGPAKPTGPVRQVPFQPRHHRAPFVHDTCRALGPRSRPLPDLPSHACGDGPATIHPNRIDLIESPQTDQHARPHPSCEAGAHQRPADTPEHRHADWKDVRI
jgi:hypothetical protein